MQSETIGKRGLHLLSILQNRWVGHILMTLLRQGPQRFNALKRLIPGISAKMLSDRLVLLSDEALVEQRNAGLGGAQQLYQLTAHGRTVALALNNLLAADEEHRQAGDSPRGFIGPARLSA